MKYTDKQREKFWAKVDRRGPDDCWIHGNSKSSDGYPYQFGGGAHRVSYELAKGEIPAGLLVRHTCDNPSCVNPNHLVVGTQRDNMHDMCARGRHVSSKRKLHPWNARDIRRLKAERGLSCNKLAGIYGITPGHARNICRGVRWAGVE